MTPLRIGMDAREALREKPRGIGLYGRHLLKAFRSLAPDAEFLLYHEEPLPPGRPGFDEFMPEKARTVQTSLPGYRLHSWERLAMPWRLGRDRPSLYHGIYNTVPPRWPMWPSPPLVVSIHDLIVTWYDEDLQDPYVRYCRQATPRIVRQADAILTVSEWSKSDIVERHGVDPDKIRVTYNGIHQDFLDGAPPGAGDDFRQRFTDGRPYLYAIGSPLGRKNTGRLVEAFGRFVERRGSDSPHLLIISGLLLEQQPAFLELVDRHGVTDRVRLLDYLPREDLLAAYAGADLFVYPSLAEGWGIPVVEAQALGVPVLTSNTTAILEAGGEFARFFDPRDLDSMVDGIEQALDSQDWYEQRRDAAIARAREFTWERNATQVLEVYGDVAATAEHAR